MRAKAKYIIFLAFAVHKVGMNGQDIFTEELPKVVQNGIDMPLKTL